jgi:carnitine-CoA ligase
MQASDALSVVGRRTVADVLRAGVERTPDRPLLIFDDLAGTVRMFTWREVLARSLATARALAAAGIGRGDRLHLHLPNRPEFLFWWFGAALRAAVIVPTNTASAPAELQYILGHVGACASVTDGDGVPAVSQARRGAGLPGPVWTCDAAGTDNDGDGHGGVVAADPLDDLAVMYTSGTTSRPKGVRVTHANYVFAGECVAAGLALTPEDRFLVALPLFHANAQYYSVMSTLVTGGTVVLAARFTAKGWPGLAVAHRATVASLFAAPIRMILAKPSRREWRRHSLRVVAFAQNLTAAELAAWDRDVGAPLLQLYGMTETIGPPLMNPRWGARRPDSLGRVALGYRCRITDRDGSAVAPGEVGELRVGGEPGVSLMAGYYRDPAATAKTLAEGWLHTGDLVREDPDGLITFVTRAKDMIKRAGENVAAGEIEDVLLEHPGVIDAAVIGVPDAMREEAIVAFVVTADGELDAAGLRDWCAGRLARFRIPEFFAGRTTLPRTSVGKIQKQVLREEWTAAGTRLRVPD